MKRILLSLIAAAVVATASSARSATQTFFGQDLNGSGNTRLASHPNSDAARTSFISNLAGVSTETLESFSNGQTGPLTVTFSGAGNAVLSGGDNIVSVPSGTNGYGRYPISGSNYWETTSSSFQLAFTNPQAAFGFYGVDIGDIGGQLTLTLVGGGTINLTVPNNTTGSADGSVLYYGLLVDPGNEFTKITFGNSNAGSDVFAFDDFTIGTREQVISTVPLPASAWAGLSMLGLLGGCAKLRKRSSR